MEVVKEEEEENGEVLIEEQVEIEMPSSMMEVSGGGGGGQNTITQYIQMPASFSVKGEVELGMKCELNAGDNITEIIFINVNDQTLEEDMVLMEEEPEPEPEHHLPQRGRGGGGSGGPAAKRRRMGGSKAAKGQGEGEGEPVQNENFELLNRESCSYSVRTIFLKCSQVGCDARFGDKKARNAHLMNDHSVSPFQCPLTSCNERCTNSITLGEHIRTNHGSNDTVWPCIKCGSEFKKYKLLYMHQWIMHDEGEYQCPDKECVFSATYRKQVYNHIDHTHQAPKHRCPYQNCTKAFITLAELTAHQRRIHLMQKPYRCKWPNCKYSSEVCPAVVRHIRTQHFHLPETIRMQREKNIVDTRNPREFLEILDEANDPVLALEPPAEEGSSSRRRGGRKYYCEYEHCDKFFLRAFNLKVHQRLHLGLKPFMCKYDPAKCDFSSERRDIVLQHIRIDHLKMPRGQRDQAKWRKNRKDCPDASNYLEVLHEEFDDAETKKKLALMQSGATFENQTEALMRDGRIREEIEVVAADDESGGELLQVIEAQMVTLPLEEAAKLTGGGKGKRKGDRPRPEHICTVEGCGKSFRRPSNLKDHQRVHTGAKPFKCQWEGGSCPFVSSRKENVVQHVRTNHLGLPRSRKEQEVMGIPSSHPDPQLFVGTLTELLDGVVP